MADTRDADKKVTNIVIVAVIEVYRPIPLYCVCDITLVLRLIYLPYLQTTLFFFRGHAWVLSLAIVIADKSCKLDLYPERMI